MPAAAASAPIAQALPVVRRALKILADREVTPQTGLLKSTLLQLDSTFSERNYGASSFLDFAEKLAKSGYVHLKTSGRSVTVELNESFVEERELSRRCFRPSRVRRPSRTASRRRRRPARFQRQASTNHTRNRSAPRSAIRQTACRKQGAFWALPRARAGRCICATSNRFCVKPKAASTSGGTGSAG
jgi:hypothetical protein